MKSSFHFVFIILLLAASTATAETRYVSDVLVVTVRSTNGDNYEVLETLITATPVEILEEDKTFVKVVTPKGTEGYIQKQYISKETPKVIRINQLQKENTALQQKLAEQQKHYQGNLAEADANQTKTEELVAQLAQTRKDLAKVSEDYKELLKNSENVLNLSTENEQLIEQSNTLNSELLILREENRNFHRSNMIQWFLAGGGVFFGGWLIGKISRKKQRGFSRL